MATEPEAISAHGWVYYDRCRCSGLMKYFYRNPLFPDLELTWFSAQGFFNIKYRGKSHKIPTSQVGKMDKILTQIEQERYEAA